MKFPYYYWTYGYGFQEQRPGEHLKSGRLCLVNVSSDEQFLKSRTFVNKEHAKQTKMDWSPCWKANVLENGVQHGPGEGGSQKSQ